MLAEKSKSYLKTKHSKLEAKANNRLDGDPK